MKVYDSFRSALQSLVTNKLRSALTMLGVIIGVSSVIAMVAVGNGASAQVQASILSLGSNLITVTPSNLSDQGLRVAGAYRGGHARAQGSAWRQHQGDRGGAGRRPVAGHLRWPELQRAGERGHR